MHPAAASPRTPLMLFCAALAAVPGFAVAIDLRVSKTTDSLDGVCDADCSLREAVLTANLLPGPDRILLGNATYQLTFPPEHGDEGEILDEDLNLNGDLDVIGELEVLGLGQGLSTIDGSANDRILEVLSGAKLKVRKLTLRNGRTTGYGAGIENHGDTLVWHVHLRGNRASAGFDPGQGGGIANYGSLDVHYAVFDDNSSNAGEAYLGHGGALYNSGTLWVRDTLFSNNRSSDDNDAALGGALYNNGIADVARSAFIGNISYGSGGAISNDGNGLLKLTNSTVSANQSGEYYGGAISNGQVYPPTDGLPDMRLINVTIADNRNYGLTNNGKLLVRNSLVSGNWNDYFDQSMNCKNEGPDAVYQAIGLLLGNGPGNCTADLYVENAETFTRVIYPLADNNGPTQTHALRKGSLAVDAGIGSCTQHDQRRLSRPRDGNGDGISVCDLGAYERAKP